MAIRLLTFPVMVLALLGCGVDDHRGASGGPPGDDSVASADMAELYDVLGGITVTVELATREVAAGDEVITTLSYVNNGSSPVTIGDCEMSEVGIALVEPGEEVASDQWHRPVVDCGGPQTLPPGSSGEAGTTSMLAKADGEPLASGIYDAAFELDGKTIRLPVEVTLAGPDPTE
ncbi:hypothetical protein BH10ACT3_BH10ACT3_15760 [soil metagenome]